MQFPFVVLDIVTPKSSVDVNVTPDKRNIMIERENYLLAVVRASLNAVFADTPATFDCSKTLLNAFRAPEPNPVEREEDSDSNGKESVNEENPRMSLTSLRARFAADANTSDCDSSRQLGVKKKVSDVGKQIKLDSFVSVSQPPKRKRVQKQTDDPVRVIEITQEPIADQESQRAIPVHEESDDTSERNTEGDQNQAKNDRGGHVRIGSPEITEEDDSVKPKVRSRTVSFSVSKVLRRYQMRRQVGSGNTSSSKYRQFLSKISPEDNFNAEAELQKHIAKADFLSMSVVGQFNLGFIIGRLRDDLFIVDQHASDEKFNFERLQAADNILVGQDMVVPQKLELTVAAEAVLTENLDVFRRNGFEFDIAPGEVRLTRIPHHRNWIFGKEDVDELIFMLTEDGGGVGDSQQQFLRPSRVRAMFASRACRTSVMVGTALSPADMRRLVRHMAEMSQPWNCPHGRPTMRHLINLNMV